MPLPIIIEEFINKNTQLKKSYLKVSFRLDICLHLDESNLFEIREKSDKLIGIIYCEDIVEEADERYGKGTNIELTSDIAGAFRFTRINLIIPSLLDAWEDNLVPQIEKDALYAINKFLDSYKLVTKRFGIENIFNLSSLRELNIISSAPGKTTQGVYTIQFSGGLTLKKPLRPQDEVDKIKELTSQHESLDIVDRFLLDAYKYLSRDYALQALINAVTAVQLKWKEFYSSISIENYNLTAEDIKILKDRYNLPGKIKITFSKILHNSLPEDIVNLAVNAIKERNEILHDGKRVLSGDIKAYIRTLQDVIDALIL